MFNDITPLQFYCHKILPLVYDDSLSYYEVLCKVQQKLNELIENNNELIRQWELYKNEIDKAFDEYKKQLQAQINEMKEDISAFEEMINTEIAAFKNTVNTKLANQTKAINDFKTEVNNRLAQQDTTIQENYDAMLRSEAQHKAEVKNTLDGFEQTMNTRLSQQDSTIQANNEAMLRSEAQHKADVKKILDGFEAKLNKAIADYNRTVEEIPSLVNTQVNKWFTDNLNSLIAQITSKIEFPKPLVQMCDEKVYAQIRKADVNTDFANHSYYGHAMSVVDVNSEVLGIDNVPTGTKIKVMFTLSHVNINAWDCSIAMYGLDEEHNYSGFKKMILIPHSLAYPGKVFTMFADSQFVYYVVEKDLYKMGISAMIAAENGAEVEGTKVIELVVTPDAGCITEKGEMYFFSSISSISSSITYYSAIPNPPNVVPSPATIIFNYNHFWRQGSFSNPGGDASLQFMYTDSENIYVGGRNDIDGFCNRIDVYTRKDIASNGSQYLPIANLECGGGACYNNKEVYFLHNAKDGGLLFTGTNRVTTADFDFVRGNLVQRNNIRMFNTNDFTDIYCNKEYTGFFVDGTSSRPYPHLRDAINSYAYINQGNITFFITSDMDEPDVWGGGEPIVIQGFPNGLSIFGGDGNRRKIPRLAITDSSFVRINCVDIGNGAWFNSITVHGKEAALYFENCSYVEVTNTNYSGGCDYAIAAINTPVHIKSGCEISSSEGTATFYSDSTGAIYFDSEISLPEGATIESPHANMLPADIKTCISMASRPLSETIPDISGCNIKDVKRDGKYKYVTTDVAASTSNLPNVLSGTVWVTVKNLGSDVIEYETVGANTSYNNASWCGYMSGDTLSWRPKHGYSVGVTLSGTTGTLSVLYTGTGLSFIHGTFTVTDTITTGSVLYTFGGTNVLNCGAGENPVEISNSTGAVSHGLNIKNNQIVATHDITAGTYNVSGEFAVTYKSI